MSLNLQIKHTCTKCEARRFCDQSGGRHLLPHLSFIGTRKIMQFMSATQATQDFGTKMAACDMLSAMPEKHVEL